MYQSQKQNWVEVVGAASVTLRYIAYGVFRAESFAPIPLLFVLMRWLARWCQGFSCLAVPCPPPPYTVVLMHVSVCCTPPPPRGAVPCGMSVESSCMEQG